MVWMSAGSIDLCPPSDEGEGDRLKSAAPSVDMSVEFESSLCVKMVDNQ